MTADRTDLATLAARLDAVERALTDDGRAAPPRTASTDGTPAETTDRPSGGEALEETRRAVDELERRVGELTAELDAVRGLLGGVEAVNASVERRADLALAAVERLASDRENEGLVVERLPEAPDSDDPDALAGGGDADRRRAGDGGSVGDRDADSESDSLAARLREAL